MRAAPVAVGCCLALAAGWYAARVTAENFSGSFPCTVANIVDGDTFDCAERNASGRSIRVRLAGVDARELGDYCDRRHPCASAHADEATAALSSMALGQALSCQPNGSTYGRIAAFCSRPDGVDLSCAMVAGGYVVRWERYWRGHSCPA